MKIHFICSGNTNRSRMAEAYLRSKNIKGLEVSSSGIYATHNLNGSLSSYARLVLEKAGILEFASKNWQQTTKEILEDKDLIIFMAQNHFDFCKNNFGYNLGNYLIWNIKDVDYNPEGDTEEERHFKAMEDEEIFKSIVTKVDELISSLNQYEKN